MKVTEHPELQEGEVFFINIDPDGFEKITWETKRMGKEAFDIYGEKIPASRKLFPVFVQRTELEDEGVDAKPSSINKIFLNKGDSE